MKSDKILRKELLALVKGGQAHMGWKVLDNFPPEHYNSFATNVDYTFWHLLEHIRLSQQDIVEFILNPDYRERQWPKDYWPPKDATCTKATWQSTCDGIFKDQKTVEDLIKNESIDLESDLPLHPGYSYLREIMLIADHNAYHIGEFGILRQVMGLW
jgi:hypothetical protein